MVGPDITFMNHSLHEELKELKKYRKLFLHILWLLGRQRWHHWLLKEIALVGGGAHWGLGRRGGKCDAPPLWSVILRGIFSFGVK